MTCPSRLRADVAREPRRPLGFLDQVDRPGRDDDQERLPERRPAARRRAIRRGHPRSTGLITASCSRSSWSSLTEAGPCRTPGVGPVQPRTSLRPWWRQVSRQSVAANGIACSIASRCSGAGLGPRQPGIDQDGKVLLVLLLEFLDHRLAAAGRRPPVDPAAGCRRAGSRAARGIPPAAPSGRAAGRAGSRSPAAAQEPATGEMADLGINQHLVGDERSRAVLHQAERGPRPQIEVAELVLAPFGARALPADPRPLACRDLREEDPVHDRRGTRRSCDRPESANLRRTAPAPRTSDGRFRACNR